ncbi:beta-ketoacyl-acyl-carrier-protein synthase II [Propionibacterium sp. oral taxon 192 str. F0372]|uniref:beta-ketoacyl-[acyl-carrier-protein] synthase family protein n=1 Tax=Propionibacterium sp. oral taxon 192 TaxID=671222 RepID=UPI000353C1EC|nr:beta-ketoacyl-[acyl-carrier-protein] synthase family protein [Propionibacterium sp. oral taxon 192]EPH00387.1 beta-ketoacyl-acyl-carrier-protein synthase II [Propionibacterium sp. oral taxon 192 str. F0372]
MTEVVITGFGVISPLGNDAATTWSRMLTGASGVRRIEGDWVSELPVQIAGSVDVDINGIMPRVEARRMDRVSQLAVGAGVQAWSDAGFGFDADNGIEPERLAVSVGTGIGGLVTTLEAWDTQREKGTRRVSPFTVPMLMANAPAAQVGLRVGAKAGVHAPVSACASSNEAIALGVNMLRLGEADTAVVGGSEAVIHAMPIAAFAQMQALSRRNDEPQKASRPWDKSRDGFVIGEGATMMVIETLEHAKSRGAKIYGTIAGSGISADSHDLVQPDPSGAGQISAMVKALRHSGVTPSDIAHVNAHGTSTLQGDVTEAHSVRSALGSATDQVVVTSTKSMTGHLLGAAGALETFATVMALRERIAPPTINLEDPEDGLEITIAANVKQPLRDGDLAALNNSFGFGGHNVTLVLTNANVTD